jgi:HPt (histidine-containing phosphotransfer) domain-containing protein
MSQDAGRDGPLGEEELLAQLRAHYVGGSAERLAGVDRVLSAARAAPTDAAASEALHRQLHMLAGSAGSYGFPQLSADARALEKQVSAAAKTGELPASLLQAVADFREEMAAQLLAAGARL